MQTGYPNIITDPQICGGRPIISGTRMRVTDVLEMLSLGASEYDILADYPYIALADVRACLAYAAAMVDHPIVMAAE